MVHDLHAKKGPLRELKAPLCRVSSVPCLGEKPPRKRSKDVRSQIQHRSHIHSSRLTFSKTAAISVSDCE
jgi:hypothetical protein